MVLFPRDTDPDTTLGAGFRCGGFGKETTSDRSNR